MTATETTDQDPTHLLELARAGDMQALEELLQALQPQIYRFGMKMCRQSEDAEDVVQDTMLTLARSFRDFRGASSISTWLYTITRSFCIKKRRKSKFAPKVEESLEELHSKTANAVQSSEPGPEAQAESKETWEHVQTAIRALDPGYREVLMLRDVEGLKAREVAEVVGISVPAVKSRLHRARAELRDHLAAAPIVSRPGCPDIRKVFSEHIEGDLSPDICATMEAHIADCPMCASECTGLQATLNACSSAPCEVPAEIQERLRAGLREALRSLPN